MPDIDGYTIGDPVEVRYMTHDWHNALAPQEEWKAGTICFAAIGSIGVAFADGTRTMFPMPNNNVRGLSAGRFRGVPLPRASG
jgi:hypothetical protein